MKVSTNYDFMVRVPDDWRDRSVMIFAAPGADEGAMPANFVATRGTLADEQTLSEFADQALYDCAQKFDGFELIEQRPVTIGGRQAFSMTFRWDSPKGSLTQTQAYVLGEGTSVLCLTATAPTADHEQLAPVFRDIWQSIRLTKRE